MTKLKWETVKDISLPIKSVVMLREVVDVGGDELILFVGLIPTPIDLQMKKNEDKFIRGKVIFIPEKEVNDSEHSGWLVEDILKNNVLRKVLFEN